MDTVAQVIPDPQPISLGSISQGISLLRTKMILVSILRRPWLAPGMAEALGLGQQRLDGFPRFVGYQFLGCVSSYLPGLDTRPDYRPITLEHFGPFC